MMGISPWFKATSVALLALSACTGNQEAVGPQSGSTSQAHLIQAEASVNPPVETVSMPITQLERRDVLQAVDAGLGHFLGYFDTEASLNQSGEFEGFRIVRINEPSRFRGLGLGPGDVVTSVNGRPIERPAQAYEAFLSLREAESLDIAYLRGGRTMRLSLPIVDSASAPD